MRKGQIFELDIIMALVILALGFAFLQFFVFGGTDTSQNEAYAEDAVRLIAEQRLESLSSAKQSELYTRAPGLYENGSTILRQIMIYKINGKDDLAEDLATYYFERTLPKGYNANLTVIDVDQVYPILSTQPVSRTRSVSTARAMLSGFRLDQNYYEGFGPDVRFTRPEHVLSAKAPFGGFVGQGDLQVHLDLPEHTNLSNFFFEGDLHAEADIFINGNSTKCDTIGATSSQPLVLYINRESLHDDCKNQLREGRNNLTLEFGSGGSSAYYVGGGFFHVNYVTDTPPEFPTTYTVPLPLIDGDINLYDGLYIPEDVTRIDLELTYEVDEAPEGRPELFFTFGDDEEWSENLDEPPISATSELVELEDLEMNVPPGETVPYRFGFSEYLMQNSNGTLGIHLAMDTSDSMSGNAGSAMVPACSYLFDWSDTRTNEDACLVNDPALCTGNVCGYDWHQQFVTAGCSADVSYTGHNVNTICWQDFTIEEPRYDVTYWCKPYSTSESFQECSCDDKRVSSHWWTANPGEQDFDDNICGNECFSGISNCFTMADNRTREFTMNVTYPENHDCSYDVGDPFGQWGGYIVAEGAMTYYHECRYDAITQLECYDNEVNCTTDPATCSGDICTAAYYDIDFPNNHVFDSASIYNFTDHNVTSVSQQLSRWDVAKQAAKEFINDTKDNISIAQFGISSWATTTKTYSPWNYNNDYNYLDSRLESFGLSGETCPACILGDYIDDPESATFGTGVFILFTDGDANRLREDPDGSLNTNALCDDTTFMSQSLNTDADSRAVLHDYQQAFDMATYDIDIPDPSNNFSGLENHNFTSQSAWDNLDVVTKDELRTLASQFIGPSGQAVCYAKHANEFLGTHIYTITFQVSTAAKENMLSVARVENRSNAFDTETAGDLSVAFDGILDIISQLEYDDTQIVETTSIPDSALTAGEFTITRSAAPSYDLDIGKLLVSVEQRVDFQQTGSSCDAFVNVPEFFDPYDANLYIYSGPYWLMEASVNGTEVYDITSYGAVELPEIGDPFDIYIPDNQFNQNNEIEIALHQNVCPDRATIFYTAAMDSVFNNQQKYPTADGCEWTVELFTGETVTRKLPGGYIGGETCRYDSDHYIVSESLADPFDAYQQIIFSLFSAMDGDGDGRLDADIFALGLDIGQGSIENVPYLFGPAVAEVSLWD